MNWFLILLLIIGLAISPIVPLLICEQFKRFDYINESNSIIAVFPWLLFFTVPIGAVVALGWIVYGVVLLVR